MRISVKLFGPMKEALAQESLQLEIPEDSSVESLLEEFEKQAPEDSQEYVKKVLPSCMVALDQEYVYDLSQSVKAESEIAIIPPISGG